ncbi:MAG: hypothetical protein RLY14_2305 [Planctomycetota bacterium]
MPNAREQPRVTPFTPNLEMTYPSTTTRVIFARKNRGLLDPGFLKIVFSRCDLEHFLESVGYAEVDTLHPVTRFFELKAWIVRLLKQIHHRVDLITS